MTDEQIADLRETAASAARGFGMAGVDRYCAVIGHEELTRLIEEREALLEGAKYLVDNYPERQATRYMLALKKAISFAAEPLDIDPVHRM